MNRKPGSVELVEIGWDADLCLELVRTLLYKEVGRHDLASLAAVFGIDTGRSYTAFRAHPAAGCDPAVLAAELGAAQSTRLRPGLVATIDGELVGFCDIPPKKVSSGVVGLGPPRRPERLAESFGVASRVLEVARLFGSHGVHSLDTLGLLPTIAADADVGEILQRRYLVRAGAGALLPELIGTVGTYFASGMNVDRAAAELMLHANTVRNRLARFEELIGASLRDLTTAMEVWWALQRTAVAGMPAEHLIRIGAESTTATSGGAPPVTGMRRAEFLRGLLRGTLPPAELRSEMLAHGMDGRRDYQAFRARPARGVSLDELARAHGLVFGQARLGGLGAVVGGDLVGFVAEAPGRVIPGISGIGPARPLPWLSESFRMASRALEIAESRNWSGVCEFEKIGLTAAVCADDPVADALRRRYLHPLGDNEFAHELMETLHVYLDQGRSIAQTAERLFVHPNTVRYRIGRFEDLTGANLRRTQVVFEVLGALQYRSARLAAA